MCNYCYKCSLWTEKELTTKNDLGVDWESYKDVDGNSLDDLILEVLQNNFDCGNTYGYYYPKTYSGMYDTHSYIPAAYFIGTGIEGDVYWQYEFVDCENGIKYWHAYRPPALAPLSTYSDKPTSVGIHYSLPIVY